MTTKSFPTYERTGSDGGRQSVTSMARGKKQKNSINIEPELLLRFLLQEIKVAVLDLVFIFSAE